MRIRSTRSWAATALGGGAIALACTGSLDVKTKAQSSPSGAGSSGLAGAAATGGTTGEQMPQIPFEPVSARIYVAKVKNLLLGLPATEEEIAAVTADPGALKGMVDAWFVKPEAQAKLSNFFSIAFQQ